MNQLLEQTKKALLDKADPRLRKPIEKTVEAGRTILYAEKTRQMVITQLKQSSDPEAIGAGVAKLIGILYKQAPNGGLPMQVAVPAAMLLLCEVLAFLEEAGAVQINPQFLAECTSATGSSILQMFGASPEQLQAFINKGAKPAAPAGGGQPATPAQPPGVVAGAIGGM